MAGRDLRLNLVMRTQGYVSGLRQAKRETSGFAGSAERAQATVRRLSAASARAAQSTANVSGKMGKATQAATQMTFALDDAASVYGTSGLAGSVRAAANNLTMVAAIMGGLKAQIAATVVLVGVQLWQAFSKQKDKTDEARKAVEEYKEALDRLTQNRVSAAEFEQTAKGMEDNDSVQEQIKKRQTEIDALEAANAEIQAQVGGLYDTLDKTVGGDNVKGFARDLMSSIPAARGSLLGSMGFGQGATDNRTVMDAEQREALRQKAIAAEEKLKENQLELQRLSRERNRLQERSAQLTEQEIGKAKLAEKIERERLKVERMLAESQAERAQQELAAQMQSAGQQLARDIGAIANPEEARRQQIKEERDARIASINALGNTMSKAQRDLLRTQANLIAARDLKDLESSKPAREQIMTGPTAIERGSQEAFAMQRRIALQGMLPKQQKTEDLLAKLERLQQKQLEELKKQNQRQTNRRQPPVGAFGGAS